MWADLPGYPALHSQFPDDLPESVAGHGLAAIADKEVRAGPVFKKGWSAALQIILNNFTCGIVKGYHPFLVPLAQNADMAAAGAASVHGQVDQLGNPDAGGIEQVQHGIVAQNQGRGFFRQRQHLIDFFDRQGMGKAVAHFRGINISYRIAGQEILRAEKIKKSTQGGKPAGIAA